MPSINQGHTKLLRIGEILYLSLIVFSLYLLIESRTGEAHTIWQVLRPEFIPTLFVTTFLLITILSTSEKTAPKLLFVILHSIMIHSLFSIIFPAGDLSGQQIVLGQTRRVFDNTILHGLSGWPKVTVSVLIVEMFKGINLQAAISTIFARTLSIDIFYVHLIYIPILWGVFVPIGSFLTTKALGGSEKAAVLASLLVSAFPYTVYFGAISVPNSLGFIFFFFALFFMLKYLSSDETGIPYWAIAFSLFSFLSHYLTGIVSFSLLLLTAAFKAYENEKKPHSLTTVISFVTLLVVSVSLLPLSFIYLRFLGTSANPVFTLDKFYELPLQEIISLFFLGELTYGFDIKTIFLVIIGPVIALLWMVYLVYHLKKNPDDRFRACIHFLFAAFLTILVDYRILKIFMSGLPLNEERLWVFRDLIAAPFVALAIYAVVSSIEALIKAKSPPSITVTGLKASSRGNVLRVLSLLPALTVLVSMLLGGWITLSLSAAYPRVAPLQTTWYELEAVRYIEANTHEKYVVIGDIWTIYAGEMIVGINNPNAYYFGESDKIGHDLFVRMKQSPSPQVMLEAMNYTDTTVAYFIVTEPRLGTDEFNNVVSRALQDEQLTLAHDFGAGKLYVFSYKKG